MDFVKKEWVNVPDPSQLTEEELNQLPRFDADNMNRIEDGIDNAHKKNTILISDINDLIEKLNHLPFMSIKDESGKEKLSDNTYVLYKEDVPKLIGNVTEHKMSSYTPSDRSFNGINNTFNNNKTLLSGEQSSKLNVITTVNLSATNASSVRIYAQVSLYGYNDEGAIIYTEVGEKKFINTYYSSFETVFTSINYLDSSTFFDISEFKIVVNVYVGCGLGNSTYGQYGCEQLSIENVCLTISNIAERYRIEKIGGR